MRVALKSVNRKRGCNNIINKEQLHLGENSRIKKTLIQMGSEHFVSVTANTVFLLSMHQRLKKSSLAIEGKKVLFCCFYLLLQVILIFCRHLLTVEDNPYFWLVQNAGSIIVNILVMFLEAQKLTVSKISAHVNEKQINLKSSQLLS